MNATKTHLLISVLEASKATGFPIRKWIQWILRGLIPSEPELNADHIKGIERILNGPKINSFENYYISKGESLATGKSPAANVSNGKEQ